MSVRCRWLWKQKETKNKDGSGIRSQKKDRCVAIDSLWGKETLETSWNSDVAIEVEEEQAPPRPRHYAVWPLDHPRSRLLVRGWIFNVPYENTTSLPSNCLLSYCNWNRYQQLITLLLRYRNTLFVISRDIGIPFLLRLFFHVSLFQTRIVLMHNGKKRSLSEISIGRHQPAEGPSVQMVR